MEAEESGMSAPYLAKKAVWSRMNEVYLDKEAVGSGTKAALNQTKVAYLEERMF